MKNYTYIRLIAVFGGLSFLPVTGQMPVELTEFKVNADMGVNRLYWETASEINNHYFIIEKSQDAISYESMETVEGNGNSNTTKKYYATDNNPFFTTYYRLKQIDFDGSFRYYGPITITNENLIDFLMYNIYPNPSDELFFIDLFVKSQYSINLFVYNLAGTIVYTSQITGLGKQSVGIDAVSWPSGIYTLTITTGENNVLSNHRMFIK